MPPSTSVPAHDNNFNSLRLVAAITVLVSHSFPLVHGSNAHEPLMRAVGITMGTLAVDGFFVISGFLNTRSLQGGRTPLAFLRARALRVYPALWVMLIATTLWVGLLFSRLPLSRYLSHPHTIDFLFHNATLLAGARYALPAVFEAVPYPLAVNGSLWSLPIELHMYLGLLAIWVLAARGRVVKWIVPGLAVLAGGYYVLSTRRPLPYALEARLLCAFAQGASFALWEPRDRRLPWRPWPTVALVIGLLGSAWLWRPVFVPLYVAGVGFLWLAAAHAPLPRSPAWRWMGDPSYGVYIYAFPIQQSAVAAFHIRSVTGLVAVALPLTLALAWLSWRFVEAPALRLKGSQPPPAFPLTRPAA